MEATGSHNLSLAYYLAEQGEQVVYSILRLSSVRQRQE
jgi:hypothetical protein